MRRNSLLFLVWAPILVVLTASPGDAAGNRERNREAAPGQFIAPDAPKAAGGTCAGAIVLNPNPPLTLLVDGNNCPGTTNVSNYSNATCNAVAYPGPEIVYEIDIPSNTAFFSVSLIPSATADLGVFLVSDCTDPTSCVDFHDAIGAGSRSQIPRLQAGSFPGGTYYIFVDSYYAQGAALSCGDYRLEVFCDVPVELLRFTID